MVTQSPLPLTTTASLPPVATVDMEPVQNPPVVGVLVPSQLLSAERTRFCRIEFVEAADAEEVAAAVELHRVAQ